jgi:mRNA-degrading endonuclease HigB of HigAB toxin-antitoxin module
MERIFAKSTLRSYLEIHAETEQYLKTWYEKINAEILTSLVILNGR